MDISEAFISGTANYAGKISVKAIYDKMRMLKSKDDKDEVINNFEEIIKDLINEKNELNQIIQKYEELLVTQKIDKKEIDYLTNSIVPLLEELSKKVEGEDADKFRKGIDDFKPILSKETFNILQILGFNFKKAIGEPLTELTSALISSKIPTSKEKSMELQILKEQKEIEYFKIVQDEEAYQRLFSKK